MTLGSDELAVLLRCARHLDNLVDELYRLNTIDVHKKNNVMGLLKMESECIKQTVRALAAKLEVVGGV